MSTRKDRSLDFSKFPPGSVTEYTTLVCLACIFDVFTNQLRLAPRTAYAEIRKYSPTIEELTAPQAVRPFFDTDEQSPHCPYCNASKRWHARLDTFGIEGIKVADALRRELVKSLPKKDEQFRVLEAKTDRRQVFFAWLDTLRLKVDLEKRSWLLEAARAYLERVEPKTDWSSIFDEIRTIRRASRLEEGWEREGGRLFLSPALYGEVLVVQYLLSRSHTHGGYTFEGRLTLTELIRRLRYFGYLKVMGLGDADQFEILDSVIEKLAGGTGAVRMYYLVDRREFLEKVKAVYAKYAA
jgi:Holliday junction resolvase-like predicted endonuclease